MAQWPKETGKIRHCPRCDTDRDERFFAKGGSARRGGGLEAYCRFCQAERNAANYRARKEARDAS